MVQNKTSKSKSESKSSSKSLTEEEKKKFDQYIKDKEEEYRRKYGRTDGSVSSQITTSPPPPPVSTEITTPNEAPKVTEKISSPQTMPPSQVTYSKSDQEVDAAFNQETNPEEEVADEEVPAEIPPAVSSQLAGEDFPNIDPNKIKAGTRISVGGGESNSMYSSTPTENTNANDEMLIEENARQIELRRELEDYNSGGTNNRFYQQAQQAKTNYQRDVNPYDKNYIPGGASAILGRGGLNTTPPPIITPTPEKLYEFGRTISGGASESKRRNISVGRELGHRKVEEEPTEIKIPISSKQGDAATDYISAVTAGGNLISLLTRYPSDELDKVYNNRDAIKDANGNINVPYATTKIAAAMTTNHVWDTIASQLLEPNSKFVLYSGKRTQPDMLYELAKNHDKMSISGYFRVAKDPNTGEGYLAPSAEVQKAQTDAYNAIAKKIAEGKPASDATVKVGSAFIPADKFLREFKKSVYETFRNFGAEAMAKNIADNIQGAFKTTPPGSNKKYKPKDMSDYARQVVLVKIIDNLFSSDSMPIEFSGRKP